MIKLRIAANVNSKQMKTLYFISLLYITKLQVSILRDARNLSFSIFSNKSIQNSVQPLLKYESIHPLFVYAHYQCMNVFLCACIYE